MRTAKQLLFKSIILPFILIASIVVAQTPITGAKSVPGNYSSIKMAIDSLNFNGVGAGGVTFNVLATWTETAPTGGYRMTATGSSSNPIVFQRSGTGVNPLISAPVGAVTVSSASTTLDGIWTFVGSDYVTINGIDLVDNNTMPSGANSNMPDFMEYGYGFFKNSAADGCQNNSVKNCKITLNNLNGLIGPSFGTNSFNGATGILFSPTKDTAISAAAVFTPSAASGTNSSNTIYTNNFLNCYTAVGIFGYSAASPYTLGDANNDIGGNLASTGNNILSFGTGLTNYFVASAAYATNAILVTSTGLVYRVSVGGTSGVAAPTTTTLNSPIVNGSCTLYYLYTTVFANAILVNNQYGINISYNNIVNSGNGNGAPSIVGMRAIYIGTAAGASATVTYNNINLKAIASASNLEGIQNAAGSTANGNTINISNNTLSLTEGLALNSTTGVLNVQPTSSVYGIYSNGASPATLSVTNNTFTNDTNYSTSGTTYMIYNTGAVTTTINLNNNTIGNIAFPGASANTGTIYGIYTSSGSASTTLNTNNNIFQNFNFTTTATGTIYFIYNSTQQGTSNMNSNNYNNLTLNSTAACYFAYNSNATQTTNFNNNFITTAFNKTGAGGTLYGYYNFGSPGGGIATFTGNNFSNITLIGATALYGIYQATSTSQQYIGTNNIVNNVTSGAAAISGLYFTYGAAGCVLSGNTVSNITCASTLYGIQLGTTASTSLNCFSNNINSLTTTGAAAVYGIYHGAGTATNMYQNKLFAIQANNAGGTSFGIYISGATTVSMYNNVLGNITAPISTITAPTPAVTGIYLSGGTTINMYYNTVNLNATSSGANFGSAALYTSTTPTLTLRNNILINNSIANGTGKTITYQRSSTTLTSYANTSNNNVFYSGATPSSTYTLFYDGTNVDSTLVQLKAFVAPRDAASNTENTTFISTSGVSSNFLNPDSTVTTVVESGASNIAGITTDFNGRIRAGNAGYTGTSTSPDIGAFEGNLIGIPMVYDSSNVDQIITSVPVGATNQAIVAIRVYAENSYNALTLTRFKLNTAGSTSAANMINAKVFYTGSSSVFSSATQYGTTVVSPSGLFYVNGSSPLAPGVNYFWVTYDVSASATPSNVLDVRVDSLLLSGVNRTPINGNPTGSRTILGPMSGTYLVGLGQTYTTITSAIADLNALGVSGAVSLQLTSLYSSASETFPITFGAISGVGPTKKVTVIPQTGATGLSIVSSNTTATIDMNGCSYIVIDGRPGGTGSRNLAIGNTSTSGVAIRFINDACFNTIQHDTVYGVNSASAGGVIFFSTTSGVRGNDSNTVDNCDIKDGATTPATTIYSAGNTTTTALNNSNNFITNNNIYNFWNATIECNAFKITAGSTDWIMSGNSMFQTATRTATAAFQQYIWNCNNTGANNHIMTNNYIGGSAPLCGGTPWTANSSVGFRITGAYLNVGVITPSTFSGNTFANINLTSAGTAYTTTPGVFSGPWLVGGLVNVNNNTFGSMTSTNSIVVNSGIASNLLVPIGATGTPAGTISIKGNNFGGITINGSSTSINSTINLINITTSTTTTTYNIDSNTFGNGLADNIIAATASVSATGQQVAAILSSAATNLNIRYNTIQNFRNNAVGTSTTPINWLHAIDISGNSIDSIIGNSMFNFNIGSTYQNNNTGSCALMGIRAVPVTAGNYISGNQIYGFSQTYTGSNAVSSIGILTNNMLTPSIIQKNIIHSFNIAASGNTSSITAIYAGGGSEKFINNIIRLGIDTLGTPITTTPLIYGFYKSSGAINVLFNSVYIGGSGIGSGVANTFTFYSAANGIDSIMNNVFSNERSNSSTGGTHYAIGLAGNTTLSCNGNIYWYNGSGGALGLYGATPSTTLSAWNTLSGVDGASALANPQFINPTGTSSTFNMHISSSIPTPVERSGIFIPYITDDIDGQTRSALTPTDIGGDAGNFILSDVIAPNISHVAVGNTASTSDRTITATITDATGVSLYSTNRPRVYFKKSAAGTFVSNAGTFVSGTAQNGVWSFVISSSAMSGLTLGDSVYYYLIAQDSSSSTNISSLPSGVSAVTVNGIISNPPTNYSYTIVPGFSGTITIGSGGTYPSLTTAGGIFAAINAGALTGNVTLMLVSDLLEDGTNALNAWSETGGGNYTLSIVPDGTTERVVAGSNAGALIKFNGTRRVKVDGRFSGVGRYLRFRNRTLAGVTFQFINDAHRDTITYCSIEGVNNTTGTILFGTSNAVGGTGNDSNAVTYCLIRDTLGTSVVTGVPNTGVSSSGTSGLENSENALLNNEIYNWGYNAINLNATGTGNNWNISNNSFYQTANRANNLQIILISGGTSHSIRKNSIGGAAANRSGNILQTSSGLYGVYYQSAVTGTPSVIDSNTFANLMTSSSTGVFGVYVTSGTVNITNNTIGGLQNAWDTIQNGYDNGLIYVSGGTVLIDKNTIANAKYIGGSGNRMAGMYIAGGVTTITNNIIHDMVANSTGGGYLYLPVGILFYGTSGTHTIEGNTIYNIINNNTGAATYAAVGIDVYVSASVPVTIKRNRIYNVYTSSTGVGASSGLASGIYVGTGGNSILNNQISMGASSILENRVVGIQDVASSGTNTFYYNSVFINGTTSTGSNNSYCIQRTSTATDIVWNNIFYNKRTTAGTGYNYATGSSSATGITSASIDYNLLVVPDTSKIAELPVNIPNGISAFNTLFRPTTYNTNWMELASTIPSLNLFTDTSVGNLNINTANAASWYANGKGIALAGITGDFVNASTTRSTSISTGSTDIGSVEFTTATTPPVAIASSSPTLGTTSTYSFANRQVASINWGSTGVVPFSATVTYYSGINAPSLIAGKTQYNGYVNVNAIGSVGLNYIISIISDSAILGNVSSSSSSRLAYYSTSTWNSVTTSLANASTGILSSTVTLGSSSLSSVYTGTDITNPLPVELVNFAANTDGKDVFLKWSTANELNNRGFDIERSVDGNHFEYIGFVQGNGTSSSLNNYTSIDKEAFSSTASNIIFYRLKQLDRNGKASYSNIVEVSTSKVESQSISAYPNPFNTSVQLTLFTASTQPIDIYIMDIQGRSIMNINRTSTKGLNKVTIDEVGSLNTGIYFMQVRTGNEIQTIKLMKTQ